MAPTKFLTGELVLVDFPGYGYWPAQITQVLKSSKREVRCFGDGERGEAFPRDMIYFDEASKEKYLSNSSWKNETTRKKALKDISEKYRKKCLQNNNDKCHPKDEGNGKAKDTEVGNVQAANDGADEQSSVTQELNDLRVKYEQLQEKFEVEKRNLNEETVKNIKLENELEKVKLEHKKEIKEIQVKVQADNEEKLKKCSADYEIKITDLKKKVEEELSEVGNVQAANDGADDEQSSVTQELNDLKVKYEQLQEKFEVEKRNLNEETVKSIKLEKELEKVKLEHKEEIKEIQVKVQADNEEKLKKCSADYELKITDLKKKVEEELSAAAAANHKAEEYKINLESMIAEVSNLESLELEDSAIKHKAEISKKDNEIKILLERISQLEKELMESVKSHVEEEKNPLEEETKEPVEMALDEDRKRVGEDDSYSREKKRMKFEDEDTSVGDKKNELEKKTEEPVKKDLDESSVGPELDETESYSKDGKRLEEHQCSVETDQSHMREEENDSTGLEGNHSPDVTGESQVGEEEEESAGFEAKEELGGKESYLSKNCGIM